MRNTDPDIALKTPLQIVSAYAQIDAEVVGRNRRSVSACPVCNAAAFSLRLRAPDRFHQRNTWYEVLECNSCRLNWLGNSPRPHELAYHYGSGYHKLIATSGERKIAKRWRVPKHRISLLCEGGRLLDIGCSSGGFLQSLSGGNWELYGIEVSDQEAKRAERSSGAQVFVGSVLDAPFNENAFDVITCLDFLEHVHELKRVVQRLRGWLKPGGVVYIQVPNIKSLEALIFGTYWYGLELPRHLSHFSKGTLANVFESCGFEIVSTRTLPSCHVEKSIYYIADDICSRLGYRRAALADQQDNVSFAWRVLRKMFRIGLLAPFRHTSAALGVGPAIEGVFRRTIDP